MRIGLDARCVYDHFPGIGRYTAHLAQALAAIDHDHTLVLLYNPTLPNTRHDLAALQRLGNIELVRTSARPFSLAEQVQVPLLVRSLRLDVFHAPYYIKPYVGVACPSLVTIHDLIGRRFPHTLARRARCLFQLTTWLAVHTATRIITVSRSARDDIAYYYRIPQDHIAITPEAADPRFCPQPAAMVAAVRAKYGLPPRYVLYVGSNKPHKNLTRLVRAWEYARATADGGDQTAEVKLVLAGHYDPRYPEVQHMVVARGLTGSVLFVPNVDEVDLPALYSGAEIFAFLSYYEGFGLPPLEAMACGAPVVCAYASSLPEVVGTAALMVDPYSVSAIAAGLNRLLRNRSLRAVLREQGLRRAREFSWHHTALKTLQVYEDVVKGSR